MKRRIIGALAVLSAFALGAACEQNSSRNPERGGTTSAPTSRAPSGDTASRPGASGSSGMASGTSATSSPGDLSGTGGSGDAGLGRDAGR